MKTLKTITKYFLAFLMIAMTVLTAYQIIMRFIVNNPSSWSEEAVRFLFVWASFVAAGIGVQEHIHIGIDVLVGVLPQKLQFLVGLLVEAAVIAFGCWLCYTSVILVMNTNNQFTPALGIPRSWMYAAVVVFSVLTVIFSAVEFITRIKAEVKGEQN